MGNGNKYFLENPLKFIPTGKFLDLQPMKGGMKSFSGLG